LGRARRAAIVGVLAAIAFLMMAAVQIPLLPSAPYLTYDPSDAVGLLAGTLYGPGVGVLVVLVKDLLFLLLRAKGPLGPAADFLAASTFVAVTAWAFRRGSGPFVPRLLRAVVFGTAVRVVVMIPANFVILGLQFGTPPAQVVRMLLPIIVPFNGLKAAINAAVALLIAGPFGRSAAPWIAAAPVRTRARPGARGRCEC
jgi:riboflavin transporter FmnP